MSHKCHTGVLPSIDSAMEPCVTALQTLPVCTYISSFYFSSQLEVCRRWYKGRQQDLMGDEQTDNEYSYHRRAVPPITVIPTTTNGTSTPPTPAAEVASRQPHKKKDPMSITEKEMEKEAEAEREMQEMFTPSVS